MSNRGLWVMVMISGLVLGATGAQAESRNHPVPVARPTPPPTVAKAPVKPSRGATLPRQYPVPRTIPPRPLEETIHDAEHGQVEAQFLLGNHYEQGRGVSRDPVRAWMWWTLAANGWHLEAAKKRDLIAKTMTPVQVVQARELADRWQAKSGFIPPRSVVMRPIDHSCNPFRKPANGTNPDLEGGECLKRSWVVAGW